MLNIAEDFDGSLREFDDMLELILLGITILLFGKVFAIVSRIGTEVVLLDAEGGFILSNEDDYEDDMGFAS